MEFHGGTFVLLFAMGLYGYCLGLKKGRELAAAEERSSTRPQEGSNRQLDQIRAVAPEPALHEPPEAPR